MSVTAAEIQTALDAGHKVWSAAFGRIGWIDRTDGSFAYLRLRRQTRYVTHGVTTFERGDKVEMVWDAEQGHYIIRHPEEWLNSLFEPRQGGREAV